MAAGGGHATWAALCRGRHLEGRKYGILKFGRFWRIGLCIAIVVSSIRISIADLIGGGGNTDVCPGRQTPSRRHCCHKR